MTSMNIENTVSEEIAGSEYETAARELFPLMQRTENNILKTQYAMAVGDIIGTPGEMSQYLSGSAGEQKLHTERLVKLFCQNVCLLIGKTWVEANDEASKSTLIKHAETFAERYFTISARELIPEFTSLAESVAILLFGDIAQGDDFIEYALRIDPRLGLFYWLITEIKKTMTACKPEQARLELMLGVYFLASF